jgi:NADH-quinone oxidoreductase chain 15
MPMAHVSDTVFYNQWVQLLEWMREWAQVKGLRFDKESDFTQYIYRMERDYPLPTTVQSASVGMNDGTAVVIASVSPPQEPLKGIQLRVMGGHLEFHLHAGENGLLEGKRAFGKERLALILERVTAVKA